MQNIQRFCRPQTFLCFSGSDSVKKAEIGVGIDDHEENHDIFGNYRNQISHTFLLAPYSTPRLKCPLVKSRKGARISLPSRNDSRNAVMMEAVSLSPSVVKFKRSTVGLSFCTDPSITKRESGEPF